ncbi:MAG TPA: pilus assembly protein N-terminal domain-containing protein [Steroidobacteraceae bacterium]|nr:pilus assembly protein N-terminal domain-containing protein [Steroidobacteraceae bacterium]
MACLLLLLCPLFASAAQPALPDEASLAVGETLLLLADVRRAALGSGRVVSVATPQSGQWLLFGEAPGETSAELWLADGTRHHIVIRVHERDLTRRLDEVRELLAGISTVGARVSGRYIVLEGARAGAADRARAAEIAALFPGEVLDFVSDADWESMVQMQVRLVEVRRDQLQRLGLRWDGEAAGPVVTAAAGGGRSGLAIRASLLSELSSRIDLLQQQGLAHTLAEPVLSCRSGEVARFVSGGEIPIPVTDGFGATDVQYKEYGVILEVRPRAGRDGAIYAGVDIELSQVDTSVRVGDYPGFVKRQTSTAINSLDGETIAIAGLLLRESGRDRTALPGLGRLPVAGALFRSRRNLQRETELLVLITPYRFESGLRGEVQAVEQAQMIQRAGELPREAADE